MSGEDETSVRFVNATPDAEKEIAYCARVSNFKNQDNPNYARLIRFLIREKHWSPFEMASMTLEVETTRAISAQIIRHKSMKFQEFSQRYSTVPRVMPVKARRQDSKNRQNSIDDISSEDQKWWQDSMNKLWEETQKVYQEALDRGIARECARMILPMRSYTKLYMSATLRDWIHYINLRTGNGTQLEHMVIAEKAKKIFREQFPDLASAVWDN